MESQRKRKGSSPEPRFIANPFIKKRNLEWRVSPPPLADPERRSARDRGHEPLQNGENIVQDQIAKPVADEAQSFTADLDAPSSSTSSRSISPPTRQSPPLLDAHITHFTTLLNSRTIHPFPPHAPRLPITSFTSLFHPTPHGAHFVVTQHDHPIAGPHYDLRLQISPSSCASWAIMYGLPGDPNSRGKTGRASGSGMLRNATETRVHCLWNSFVETGGWEVGSLLVWDMGVFEVLAPRRRAETPSDSGEGDGEDDREGEAASWAALSQQERLARAFASRKIRLKLHGARLPRDYVVNLRLTKEEDAAGRAKAASTKPRRRRRRGPPPQRSRATGIAGPDTSGESSSDEDPGEGGDGKQEEATALSAMETELRELEDAEVRRTNAYVGAVNSIGSVHQRKWFLSLDREACGFVRTKVEGMVRWKRRKSEDEPDADSENRLSWPFYVRGPAFERSVVTGRKGEDVLKDHGVVGYVGRKGWRPILS